MLKNPFRKAPKAAPGQSNIQLSLKFLGFEADQNGITIGWRATGAPPDIMFDVDFLGQPSSVTTGFFWDSEQDALKNVFVVPDDTSFRITSGCAYAGNAMDGSGNVEAVWVLSYLSNAELKFEQGHQVTVDFFFDPNQRKIRIL